jgi:hypothetical protein
MTFPVIPAKAGIHEKKHFWTPAFAGVTALTTSSEAVNPLKYKMVICARLPHQTVIICLDTKLFFPL